MPKVLQPVTIDPNPKELAVVDTVAGASRRGQCGLAIEPYKQSRSLSIRGRASHAFRSGGAAVDPTVTRLVLPRRWLQSSDRIAAL
jgi:hypothetical protein